MSYHKYMEKPFVIEVSNEWGEWKRFFEATPGDALRKAQSFQNMEHLDWIQILFPGVSGTLQYLFTRHNQEEVNRVMGVKELPGSRGNILSGSTKQFFAEYHVPFNVTAIGEREENEGFSKKNDKYYERRLTLQLTQNTHEVLVHHSQAVDTPVLPEDNVMVLPLRDTFNQDNDYRANEFAYVEEQLKTNGVSADMVLIRVQSGNNTLFKLGLWDGHL